MTIQRSVVRVSTLPIFTGSIALEAASHACARSPTTKSLDRESSVARRNGTASSRRCRAPKSPSVPLCEHKETHDSVAPVGEGKQSVTPVWRDTVCIPHKERVQRISRVTAVSEGNTENGGTLARTTFAHRKA